MEVCRFCGNAAQGGVWGTGGFSCLADECWAKYRAESDERTRQTIAALVRDGLCPFDKAWVGRCKKPGSPYCPEHAAMTCVSCGGAATHDCAETGQFVCGAPLCDECEHTIFPEGHNGGIGFNEQPVPAGLKRHVKRSEQVFQPWYAREPEAGAGRGEPNVAE